MLGTGHLGPGGVWHGNLYLKGGGDPTFGDGSFNKVRELGYGPTSSQLVHQLSEKGISSLTGSVIGDGSIFDGARGGPATDFKPDLPDYGGQLSGLTFDHGANAGVSSPDVRRQGADDHDARRSTSARRPRRCPVRLLAAPSDWRS